MTTAIIILVSGIILYLLLGLGFYVLTMDSITDSKAVIFLWSIILLYAGLLAVYQYFGRKLLVRKAMNDKNFIQFGNGEDYYDDEY